MDCVIRAGELTDQSLVARRIGNWPSMTVASPAYLKRYGVPQHPIELELQAASRGELLLAAARGASIRTSSTRTTSTSSSTGPYRVSVNDSNAHLTAVLGGFGISQCITFMAEPLPRKRRAGRRSCPTGVARLLPVHVVYPPNRHLSAKVRAFVDWAADLFAKHPQLQRV